MTGFDIFEQFATDPSKELEGVWHNVGPCLNPEAPEADRRFPRIRVARSGNSKHSRIVTALYEANRTVLETKGDVAEAKGTEITVSAMAQAILTGWENMSWKGKPLADGWRLEDAKMVLEVKDFRELVNRHAIKFEDYKVHQEAEAAKN